MKEKEIIFRIINYFTLKGVPVEEDDGQINIKFRKLPNAVAIVRADNVACVMVSCILETNKEWTKEELDKVEDELIEANSIFDTTYYDNEEPNYLHLTTIVSINRILKCLDDIYDEVELRSNDVSAKYLELGE